jgi:hypothetical protein
LLQRVENVTRFEDKLALEFDFRNLSRSPIREYCDRDRISSLIVSVPQLDISAIALAVEASVDHFESHFLSPN